MSSSDNYSKGTGSIDWSIFLPSIIIILAVVIPLSINPTLGKDIVTAAHSYVTTNFGWMAMMVPPISIVFLVWISFGRYGNVMLGQPGEKPEFSDFNWACMLFCAGVGSSVMVWGVAEPIYYLSGPPLGLEPMSTATYSIAHALPTFHWGLSGWAIYAVGTLTIAYSIYVRQDTRQRLSSACSPILGRHVSTYLGSIFEVLVVVGTVGGYGTSLGLGVPFVSTFISGFLNVENTIQLKAIVLLLWTGFFGTSVYFGLDKGIKVLTQINVVIVGFVLLFILAVGPTLFIFDMTVNSIGQIISNYASLSFSMEPFNFTVDETTKAITRTGGFPQWWPIFYWFWFIALMPISALFIARISRGRTLRQVALGVMIWGTLGCLIILSIIGGYTLYLQKTGAMNVIEILNNSDPGTTAATVLQSLPLPGLMVPMYALMAMIFLATTLDSSAYGMAAICTKRLTGKEQPARYFRLLWAIILGGFSIGLLITGEGKNEALKTIQTSSVALGLPLLLAWLALMISLIMFLKKDFGENKSLHPDYPEKN